MNDRQTKDFDANKECNFAIAPPGIGRFRVSAFVQQGSVGCVIRLINAKIPTFEELDLPPILKEVVLSKRGLVILVGGTGSGKSTSLAAMVGYRNEKTRGHIITIEDPVEYVHQHKGCVITHREVGVDTDSWHTALTTEIMLNSPLIQDLIFKGEVAKIKEVMSRSTRLGMKTFDQCLFELYETGFISYEDALRNADSKNELRLRIKLESKRENKNIDDGGALRIVEEEQGRVI
jgi:Tfp pilus assembly ATPase PilU